MIEQIRGGNFKARIPGGDASEDVEALAGGINLLGQTIADLQEVYAIAARAADASIHTLDTETEDLVRARVRDEIAIRKMATPILAIWEGILLVPILGVLDSDRAADLTEMLLRSIVNQRAKWAILDLTGIESLDAGVASHLLQLGRMTVLVGGKLVLTGIRPEVARVVAGLGMGLPGTSKLTVRDALRWILATIEVRRGSEWLPISV